MRFNRLTIQNFLTVGTAAVNLDTRGLNVIQGVNEDDSSAASNGAGKSSIVDALCWCLYGVTARGIKGDGVVNRTIGKGTMVELVLTNGATAYTVRRYRKHKEHKNQLHIIASSTAEAVGGGIGMRLDKGTEAESQKTLEKILGCSYDVFIAAVYAGQEIMPDLPRMTDRELKRLIEEAAGLQRIERAYQIARARANAVNAEYAVVGSSLLAASSEAESTHLRLKDCEADIEAFEKRRVEQILEIETTITTRMAACETAKGKLDKATPGVEVARKRRKELAETLAGYEAAKKRVADLDARAVAFDRKIDRAGLAIAVKDIQTVETAIAEAPLSIGKPCHECGKPHTEADLEQHMKVLVARQLALKSAATTLRDKVSLQIATHQAAAKEAAAARAALPDVSEVTREMEAIDGQIWEYDSLVADLKRTEHDLGSSRNALATARATPNPSVKVKETLTDIFRTSMKKATELKTKSDVLNEKFKVAESVVKVFGPAGVRAQILDTVTPYLNARTSDYLSVLSDGNLSAVWTTLTRNAKGDLTEKFSIDVTNKTGADSFIGLSGGEKRKVRLACALALQDLVASRAVQPIDCWIGDEIDDALDPAGLERLMTILERKARERGTVLVISHNSLTDWCDNVTTVRKKGGVSTVEGALCE